MPLTMRDRVFYALTDIDYSDLVSMLPGAGDDSDVTIVTSERIGDYHGEHVYLLKSWPCPQEKLYAIVSLDFGSCSGCDFLEEITYTTDVEGFIVKVADYLSAVSLIWYTAEEMTNRLRTVFTPENYWYLTDTSSYEITDKFVKALVKDAKQPW